VLYQFDDLLKAKSNLYVEGLGSLNNRNDKKIFTIRQKRNDSVFANTARHS